MGARLSPLSSIRAGGDPSGREYTRAVHWYSLALSSLAPYLRRGQEGVEIIGCPESSNRSVLNHFISVLVLSWGCTGVFGYSVVWRDLEAVLKIAG